MKTLPAACLALVALASSARGDAAATPPRSRPLVVLDAGHGGSNGGAVGAVPGLLEKHLTLALTLAVRDRLAAGGVDVLLTRDRDVTLTLRQRVALANKQAADLFVSIHANASPDPDPARLRDLRAHRRRASIVDARALRSETGTPRRGVDPTTALVLDDVERGAAQWEAADLAVAIQAEPARRCAAAPAIAACARTPSTCCSARPCRRCWSRSASSITRSKGRELIAPAVQAAPGRRDRQGDPVAAA
jgi:N-acetylmuramoyl-L-alanine amidase